MAAPRFRFADTAHAMAAEEFWRDVEASERLGSRFKANLFLRELCHAKAWTDAKAAGTSDHFACEDRERALLREVAARGYRLFGPDVASANGARLDRAG